MNYHAVAIDISHSPVFWPASVSETIDFLGNQSTLKLSHSLHLNLDPAKYLRRYKDIAGSPEAPRQFSKQKNEGAKYILFYNEVFKNVALGSGLFDGELVL